MPVPTQHNNVPPKRNSFQKGSGGFTLVELLVVVAIIGVLAAIAIPAYHGYINKARKTLAVGTLDNIRKTLELYHIDYQEYPPEPIDFLTGRDSGGILVFSSSMMDQIEDDLFSVRYNSAINSYTLIAEAMDDDRTVMTLTPNDITY